MSTMCHVSQLFGVTLQDQYEVEASEAGAWRGRDRERKDGTEREKTDPGPFAPRPGGELVVLST